MNPNTRPSFDHLTNWPTDHLTNRSTWRACQSYCPAAWPSTRSESSRGATFCIRTQRQPPSNSQPPPRCSMRRPCYSPTPGESFPRHLHTPSLFVSLSVFLSFCLSVCLCFCLSLSRPISSPMPVISICYRFVLFAILSGIGSISIALILILILSSSQSLSSVSPSICPFVVVLL